MPLSGRAPRLTPRTPLREGSAAFLDHLDAWMDQRPELTLSAAGCAVVVVDLVHGFVDEGPLASSRVAGLVPQISSDVRQFAACGGRWLCICEDAHPPDSPEFLAFPPHCLENTRSSRSVPALVEAAALPGLDTTWIRKATITPQDAGLLSWAHAAVGALPPDRALVVAGDVTDLCVYQTAMALRLWANRPPVAREIGRLRVVVGLEGVQTYHLEVDAARAAGVLPHDGDLHHAVFAHHLALNAVEVVSHVQWI
ncbi:MAG TPA: isochorismatase family protein [Verrucomicrobiae bacterium]|nr:isochorismatase family protein [Verrucomicrobiae bacterium]